MEHVYALKAETNEKKYRHYTVNSFTERELNAGKKKEFFYIGKDSFIIDTLVRSFESGYAAENVEKAISILTKVVSNRNSYPDVILADSRVSAASLAVFHKFLSGNKFLATVPFLVEASNAGTRELADLRKLSFVDEIIDMHQQADWLLSKMYFIQKIKATENIKILEENITQPPGTSYFNNDLFKRIFDVTIASVVLVLLTPVFFLIALAIRLESGGSVFYIAKRAGRGYRVFDFYKFRTMEEGADEKIEELMHLNQYVSASDQKPVFFKAGNDPRITKVGLFLRNTSLDELPQFINVLLGDMSLVGNRPLPLYEAETLTTDDRATRFMAPAGITGLWQVKKRCHEGMSDEERIGIDIDYANRNNFMFDLWIMANTPTALIQKSGV